MPHLDDYRIIPVEETPANAAWILWHPQSVPYRLDVMTSSGARFATVTAANGSPSYGRYLGRQLILSDLPKIIVQAPLSDDAPGSGPALLDACFAALRRGYEASPLRLRAGRSPDELTRLLNSLAILMAHIEYPITMLGLSCDYDPDLPITPWRQRGADMKHAPDAWVIIEDLGEWFGAHATTGSCDLSNMKDGKPTAAMLDADQPVRQSSAHEVLAAFADLAAFYDKAAGDLGLSEADLRVRLALLQTKWERNRK